MSEPKGWVKRNRVFLNTPASECMAGVAWKASLGYYKKRVKGGWDKKSWTATADGSIEINEEGQRQYVGRKADLRAIRNMRKELDAFESAIEQAMQEAEDYNNAQSQATD